MNRLRRILSRKVSVEQLIETAMWLAIPYLTIGLGWSFVHADQVRLIEAQLLTELPAGADLVAFGQVALLWPLLLLGGGACVG
ncbi:hypothetical protein [Mycolicibacterium goodii]|uniref:Membrane protein n=1 Tax=Mycolicibacterium goodii TaxID=134601 RepID=A0A0K0X9T2_MYCGD|nr:membrane protein [Mycolicibacterium goodii]